MRGGRDAEPTTTRVQSDVSSETEAVTIRNPAKVHSEAVSEPIIQEQQVGSADPSHAPKPSLPTEPESALSSPAQKVEVEVQNAVFAGRPEAEASQGSEPGQPDRIAQLIEQLADIRRIAGRFGGFSVPLRRAARKFNRWLAVPAAKSLGLPPQRAGAHRAAFIRAHLDLHPATFAPVAPSCRRRRCAQSGDQRQDFGEQPAGHRDLGELERDVSAVTDDLRADFDQLFAQAGH